MSSQQIIGDNNFQFLVKDSEYIYIEVNGIPVVSLFVPPFRATLRTDKNLELSLLLATTTLTEMAGRQNLWDECLAWCNDSSLGPVSVFCLTGRGGSGKTRFALELMHHLRGLEGWDARFVRFDESKVFDLWSRTSGKNHVLLIFDYASDNAVAIAGSLRRLAENLPKDPQRRLRILLLARTASWESGWLKQFEPTTTLEFGRAPCDFFRPDKPIVELDSLSIKDRIQIFRQTYEKASEILQLPAHAVDESIFHTPRADEVLQDPLTLMMAALAGLYNGIPEALSLTRIQLAHQIANLLVTQRLRMPFEENHVLALHFTAYATLSGGLTLSEALEALEKESHAHHLGTIANPSAFVEKLAAWFPGKGGDLLGVIEPDIVGEAFVLDQLTLRQAKAKGTILSATEGRAPKVIQFLVRATQDFSHAAGSEREEPLQWLETLVAKGDADDFGLLIDIETALPAESVALRSMAVTIREKILDRAYLIVRATPEEDEEEWTQAQSWLARSFVTLAIALHETSQHESALINARKAVGCYRILMESNPAIFMADTAMSLNNLGAMQNEMGYQKDALASTFEAVNYYRVLAEQNPNSFLTALALSINNLGVMQAQIGDHESALVSAQESVRYNRTLANRNPDVFLPDLALSLNNFGNWQGKVGNYEDALAKLQETVRIRRVLVEQNSDAFLPTLIGSLNNLSNWQNAVGDCDGALASALESVHLSRELVKRNPSLFLPDLATSLANLSKWQSEIGDHQVALASVQEAIRIRSALVEQYPDAFLQDLALSWREQGQVLLKMQQYLDAMKAFAGGLNLLLSLVEMKPLRQQIDLAVELLHNYVKAFEMTKNEPPDEELLREAIRILGPYL